MLDAPLALSFLAVVLGVALGWSLERLIGRMGHRGVRKRAPQRHGARRVLPFRARVEATEQLGVVMGAPYRARPILSAREARVFDAACASVSALGVDWRVMAQVSLGEILASEDGAAFAAINSKRVDILLVDRKGWPKVAIEYQGSGHHQGTAAARDAVKKEALRRAGVQYIEVVEGQTSADLHAAIARLAKGLNAPSPAAAKLVSPTDSRPARTQAAVRQAG